MFGLVFLTEFYKFVKSIIAKVRKRGMHVGCMTLKNADTCTSVGWMMDGEVNREVMEERKKKENKIGLPFL